MISLTGSHRTGKSTLAKAWAEQNEVDFITLNVSSVISSMGFDCSDIQDIDRRIKVQRKLVEACDKLFLRQKGLFITDRCPLDVAAYTLADCGQHMTPKQAKEMNDIVLDCISITNAVFHSICIVQPGIPYVREPGKPPFNVAYQEHIHSLLLGLARDERVTVSSWTIPRWNTDHEGRMDALDSVHGAVIENATYEAEASTLN